MLKHENIKFIDLTVLADTFKHTAIFLYPNPFSLSFFISSFSSILFTPMMFLFSTSQVKKTMKNLTFGVKFTLYSTL